MTFLQKIQTIERFDQLIKLKATGSARELALRANLSKSTVYEIIDLMKSMGAEIEYCKSRRSYYYVVEKTLRIGFVAKQKVYGGQSKVSDFFGQEYNILQLLCA